MAPIPKQATDTILSVSNNDFLKHCPMRTGNVRCRNMSTCNRADFGDQNGHTKAVELRAQIMQQIVDINKQHKRDHDPKTWDLIEYHVDMLTKWSLCKKHLVQHDAAVKMTMVFLMQECGIFINMDTVLRNSQSTPTQQTSSPLLPSKIPETKTAPTAPVSTTPYKTFHLGHNTNLRDTVSNEKSPSPAPKSHTLRPTMAPRPSSPSLPSKLPGPKIASAVPASHKTFQFGKSTGSGNTVKSEQNPSPAPKPQADHVQQPSFGFRVHNPIKKEPVDDTYPSQAPPAPFGFQVRSASTQGQTPGDQHERPRATQPKSLRPAAPQQETPVVRKPTSPFVFDTPEPTGSKKAPFGFQVRTPTKHASKTQHTHTKTSENTDPLAPNEHRPLSTPHKINRDATKSQNQTPRGLLTESRETIEGLEKDKKDLQDELKKMRDRFDALKIRNNELEGKSVIFDALKVRNKLLEDQAESLQGENMRLRNFLRLGKQL